MALMDVGILVIEKGHRPFILDLPPSNGLKNTLIYKVWAICYPSPVSALEEGLLILITY
jgi:hypothetical protein